VKEKKEGEREERRGEGREKEGKKERREGKGRGGRRKNQLCPSASERWLR